MTSGTIRRRASRSAAALVAVVALTGGSQVALASSSRPVAPKPLADPYAPTYHHAYRHGAVPMLSTLRKMNAWTRAHAAQLNKAARARQREPYVSLKFQGGSPGVITGPQKVYLVFWGSQWGTQSTDSNGNVKLSGDAYGEAGILQQFFKGLGTGGETWSGVMTQYCTGVAVNSTSCPSSATHVGYPTGGALAGVWVDESAAAPAAATGHQIGQEAVNAAGHFGNTTAASQANAQYVILSPHGTNPDGWLNTYCAYHDWTADGTIDGGGAVSSPYGAMAFTNMPYVTDAGANCGANFVNSGSGGYTDGITIVEGHEYAETSTDQSFTGSTGAPGGWYDPAGASQGLEENGDKCAWITPGTTGGSFDLKLTTGTFAVQTTYANDGAGGAKNCEGSHPII